MKQLSVGATVNYRFFNTPENRFYGNVQTGVVVAIHVREDKPIEVRQSTGQTIRLHRKEIKSFQ